jgi:hypothetical protein
MQVIDDGLPGSRKARDPGHPPGFTIENGRFEILHSSFVNRDIRDSLLNEGQLIEVLGEYSKVKERVSWLESQLAKLSYPVSSSPLL